MNSSTTTGRWHATLLFLWLGHLLGVEPLPCPAQSLIPNGSFEQTDTCLLGISFEWTSSQGPTAWFSAYLHPDHLQGCLNYGAANGLPLNQFTFQEPLDGNSCIGLFSYVQSGVEEQREWAMVELLEPLLVGETYYASLYANAAFGGNAQYPQIWLATNNIGMLFTTQSREWDFGDGYPSAPNIAHIRRTAILADTVGWTLVSGSFVADSAYRYVMIGNFFNNAQTDTLHFAAPNSVFPWYPRSYTLIDKVCVTSKPDGCDMEHGIGGLLGASAGLYPNPATNQLWIRKAQGYQGSVFDALGRRLWSGTFTADEVALAVGHWARGAYSLRLEGRGEQRSYKFVLVE
ncbi:MAG TPA: T9SS type A sorting domain-containing protein [Flavobacteriales bacterium]|nr:T9SS type A sorting domain-containing protein [Flavobacteriales bacterium]